MRSELRIWWEHPLLGVGPGRAAAERVGAMRGVAAHTEFTRLLAEHGLLGAAAMIVVISGLWKRFRLTRAPRFRALILALFTFSALYMITTGMRTVLPAFALGLAFSRFDE
jgi:O-antigen ligase